jgi:hypothetical protein
MMWVWAHVLFLGIHTDMLYAGRYFWYCKYPMLAKELADQVGGFYTNFRTKRMLRRSLRQSFPEKKEHMLVFRQFLQERGCPRGAVNFLAKEDRKHDGKMWSAGVAVSINVAELTMHAMSVDPWCSGRREGRTYICSCFLSRTGTLRHF